MRLLPAFTRLPTPLLLSSLLLVSAVPLDAKTLLTPDTFTQITSSGLWFIEFFSPYCGHCRAFAPTWDKLVQQEKTDTPSVNLAQVDCSLYGDLCNEKNIGGYPTMKMFNKGEEIEKYHGSRDLSDLHKFITRHAEAVAPPTPPSPPSPTLNEQQLLVNPDGQLLTLTDATFASTLAKGPLFIKFFAPWCGHCKKLAPTWKRLAKEMQGKLNVAEVNCDDNPSTCKAYAVQQYPTLVFVTAGGVRNEYMGGRKIEQLRKFAEGASGDAVKSVKSEELERLVAEQEVVYLLVHSDGTIVDTVKRAATALLGSPIVYAVSDPALLARYSVPQTSTWALISFKDHDAQAPASILHERLAPSSGSHQEEAIREWALAHRLPTALELTQDTFQSVMNAPQAPLVVIAAVQGGAKGKVGAEVEKKMRELSKKWRVRTGGTGEINGREVIWAWMDSERWKDWMKSMYGIQVKEGDVDLDDVRVVVTDHKRLVYWDTDEDDRRLKVTPSLTLFEAVEAAVAGKLPYKNSENLVERIARYLNTKMTSIEMYVVTYPWRAAFFIFVVFVVVFLGLRHLIKEDVSHHEYRKVDRLD